jgi:hypothetical protein
MVDGKYAVLVVKVVYPVRNASGPGDEQLPIAAFVRIVIIVGSDEQVYSCHRYLDQTGALFFDHSSTVAAADLD